MTEVFLVLNPSLNCDNSRMVNNNWIFDGVNEWTTFDLELVMWCETVVIYLKRCTYLLVHPWTEEPGELQSVRFSGGTSVKEPAYQCRRPRRLLFPSLGQGDPLEEGMTTHSSILAWRILWTEEPGGIQSKGSQRVGHNWPTWTGYLKAKTLLYQQKSI